MIYIIMNNDINTLRNSIIDNSRHSAISNIDNIMNNIIDNISDGDKVSFDLESTEKGPSAINVRVE